MFDQHSLERLKEGSIEDGKYIISVDDESNSVLSEEQQAQKSGLRLKMKKSDLKVNTRKYQSENRTREEVKGENA